MPRDPLGLVVGGASSLEFGGAKATTALNPEAIRV